LLAPGGHGMSGKRERQPRQKAIGLQHGTGHFLRGAEPSLVMNAASGRQQGLPAKIVNHSLCRIAAAKTQSVCSGYARYNSAKNGAHWARRGASRQAVSNTMN